MAAFLLCHPFTDVARAIDQLDAFSFKRREELHHRPVHERRLAQVEREPRAVRADLRLQLREVIFVDLPAEPEERGLAVGSVSILRVICRSAQPLGEERTDGIQRLCCRL